MEGRAAQLLDEFVLGRKQHCRNTAAAERQRSREADWARADDNDAFALT
jgi:hypothetical protein